MKVRTGKRRVAWVLIPAAWLIGWFLSATPPMRSLELNLRDLLFEFRGPIPLEESPIVLVALSETSDGEILEKWPWPTHLYARMIRNLNRAGAVAIGIDVIFDNSDIHDPANDTLFAAALAEAGNVVLAGNVMTEVRRATDDDGGMRVDTRQLVQPLPLLMQANPNPWGFVEVERDRDGFLRRYGLPKRHLDRTYLPFGYEVLRVAYGIPADSVADTGTELRIGRFRIPKWDSRSTAINYVGPRASYPTYDFSDIIDDAEYFTATEDEDFQINTFDDPDFGLLYQEPSPFAGKIVLVGATMPELQDFYATPFAPSGSMPGFETHANAIQTALSGNHLRRVDNNTLLLITLLLTAMVGWLVLFRSALTGLLGTVTVLAGVAGTVYYAFIAQAWVVDAVPFLMTLGTVYISALGYSYLTEQREKSRIQGMFGSYVSPELVDRMVASGEEPRLGGETSDITAFFSDIRGFSSFSEQMPPERLVVLMNEYLSAMTDILIEEGGTLDKYIGDAIVAFWGAPVPLPDHAARATACALRMQLKQQELCAKWKAEGTWPTIVHDMRTRIGLNSGSVITGNMGSTRRFNYTMMGDDVNLAARCESGAKSYGVYTMVTEATRRQAEASGDRFLFRTLDKIVVKGRSQPVTVCELVAFRDQTTDTMRRCVETFEQGLEAYFAQRWDAAEAAFEAAWQLEADPGENPSRILLDRVRRMRQEPPGPDWDGVFVMTSK